MDNLDLDINMLARSICRIFFTLRNLDKFNLNNCLNEKATYDNP